MACPEECPHFNLLGECTAPLETCAFKETEDFVDSGLQEAFFEETVQRFEDACHYCDGNCGPCSYKL